MAQFIKKALYSENYIGLKFIYLCLIICVFLLYCIYTTDSENSDFTNTVKHNDSIFVDDSLVYIVSHNTVILEHLNISDISFLKDCSDIKYVDLSYTPVKNLSPLKDLKNLIYLDITGCKNISDFNMLTEILSSGDKLHCLNTDIPDEIIKNLKEMGIKVNPDRNYLHIGHPRLYDSLDQKVYPEVENVNLLEYDMLLLGGDLLRNPTTWNKRMNYLEKIYDINSTKTIWSPGNHDYEDLDVLQSYTRRPVYYTYSKNKIVYLNLDTQDSFSKDTSNNINGDQLEMVKTVTDTIQNSDALIVLTHKLIWMYDKGVLEDTLKQIVNTSGGNKLSCTNQNNFYNDVYPLLKKVKSRGIEVFCIAGDLGYQVNEFSYKNADDIYFIGSGLGPGKKDQYKINKVVIFQHNQESGEITWQYKKAKDLN